ncbi:MFS transporter [Sphingobium lactosutens]|uniref:MFS transporter n=1 Tax=Sphingobium lactosutens TaxID=522773 RepID=UPI0015BCECFE|nr:MFS transporter [Sphingobium lactosutens]
MAVAAFSDTTGIEASRPSKFTTYSFSLFLLCILIAMTEGYDGIAMSLAAPMLATEWALPPSSVGILLTTSIAGMMFGSLVLAQLGDRWGRRPTVILSLSIAGIGTAAGAVAPDFDTMLLTRVVAGVGLGMAIPNVLAIVMELVPSWFRTFSIVLVSCGYPLGSSVGGLVASQFTSDHGHKAVFLVGGVGTLLAASLCLLFLPESPAFLAFREGKRDKLEVLLQRLGGKLMENFSLDPVRTTNSRSPISILFSRDYLKITMLLLAVNIGNMSVVFFFLNWLPSLLVGKGLGVEAAIKATSIFNGAGIVGGLVLAGAIYKYKPTIVLGICFTLATAAILSLADNAGGGAFWTLIGICGAAVVGSQFCLMAIVNQFYPAEMRATGSGFVGGAGRLGAVAAPLVGGYVMNQTGSAPLTFAVAAVPAILGLVAVTVLHTRTSFGRTGTGL